MDLRIPLSCVFTAALTPRHEVPHRTLRLDFTHPFVHYLDSDDTRLPQHPALNVTAQPAEAYETYVGEDVWTREGEDTNNTGSTHNGASSASTPSFNEVVQWVMEAIAEVGGDGCGVVLCGRYVVADDCGWAVSSRTPTLYSPREVFIAMRNSSKFLHDIHHQLHYKMNENCEGSHEASTVVAPSATTGTARGCVEVTLARALGGDPVKEFRVFMPYRLHLVEGGKKIFAEVWEQNRFAGISQRATDICIPKLMEWDEHTHNENYALVMHHVEEAKILEKALETDAQLQGALLRRLGSLNCLNKESIIESCFVLLSVDILFENLSLPLHLLSAKVKFFSHDKVKDSKFLFPFIKEEDAAVNGSNTDEDISDTESDKDNREDEEEDEEKLYDSVSFFRLFRDITNWNQYVEIWRERYYVKGNNAENSEKEKKRYFVIASERSDLACTTESIMKRGVPLEFMCPELMQGDEDFQREWREKLMHCMNMAKPPNGSS
ncbi:uncharacterized protein TM35_000242220 [Trypanosoma theileri]|uniref:Uncharacterized protein n=1 Tax=Trypanosoma theileri TaxID=67003 RepID=A0A1X0NQS9_9TRYP|nr:uncharacterized protein TM35_000242220 [Trypanosoma theileri]ORC87072.1 hypothetical protein TM35_000242220 [Trypanosoma theileri]